MAAVLSSSCRCLYKRIGFILTTPPPSVESSESVSKLSSVSMDWDRDRDDFCFPTIRDLEQDDFSVVVEDDETFGSCVVEGLSNSKSIRLSCLEEGRNKEKLLQMKRESAVKCFEL